MSLFTLVCVARWGLEGGLVQGPTIPPPYTFTPLPPWQYAAPWLPAEPGSLQGWRSAALAGKEMPGGINCTCPTHWHKQFEFKVLLACGGNLIYRLSYKKGKHQLIQPSGELKKGGGNHKTQSCLLWHRYQNIQFIHEHTWSSHPAESASFTHALHISIMHVCTHPPQPLFSQTTMAISMRMVRVWSRGTAARASAAPCGFPTREGHHECDGGRKRAILTQFWDLQIVHCGFLLSQSPLSLAAIQHGHSCSFSEMSQMQSVRKAAMNAPLGLSWRAHQQQQVI